LASIGSSDRGVSSRPRATVCVPASALPTVIDRAGDEPGADGADGDGESTLLQAAMRQAAHKYGARRRDGVTT
jgi:hypothetical protein